MGRPTDFTRATADAIVERIAEGESLRSICRDDGMPNKSTVFRWLADPGNGEFRIMYELARQAQADAYFDEIVDLADRPLEAVTTVEKEVVCDKVLQPTTETRTADAVERSKLMVDARKWVVSRMNPKKYGNKLEHSGSIGIHEAALAELE